MFIERSDVRVFVVHAHAYKHAGSKGLQAREGVGLDGTFAPLRARVHALC